jgi:ClpX C4-type zinc finger protein
MLDAELLKKAKETSGLLTDAERAVLTARADYHTAIRRLHLAGGSLREIAEAMALSHQRIQQIVDEAGGSWWTRIWRTRSVKRDAICTFCGRPPSEVEKLVAGPDVYICDACVTSAEAAAAGARGAGFEIAAARVRCSFCAKRSGPKCRVVTALQGNVCVECLRLTRDIIDGRA